MKMKRSLGYLQHGQAPSQIGLLTLLVLTTVAATAGAGRKLQTVRIGESD